MVRLRSSAVALLLAMLVVAPATVAADGDDMAAMQQLAKTSDPTDVKNAQIDLEYDAAECAAYYKLQSAIAIQSGYGGTDGVKGMTQAGDTAMQLTILLSSAVGMSQDALKAQLQMDMTDLAQQIGKDYVNQPAVLQKVGMPCKELLEHPMTRMAHWLEVERTKHHP